MNSKKGQMIAFTTLNVAVTIFIFVLIAAFIFGSGVIKNLDQEKGGLSIQDETKVGLQEIFDYIDEDYTLIIEDRFRSVTNFGGETNDE